MRPFTLALGAVLVAGAALAAPGYGPIPKPGPAVRKPAAVTWPAETLSVFAEAMLADKAGNLELADGLYNRIDDDKLPSVLYNRADVQRRMENYDDAIKSYKAYLEAAPDAPDRADVVKLITQLEATPQILTIDGEDPRAVVFIDGAYVGPSPQTVAVPEGHHAIDRIGPDTYKHESVDGKPLDVRHVRSYDNSRDKDDDGNVVLSASGWIRLSGGWRDGGNEFRLPGRQRLAPGHYETRLFDRDYACGPLAFDVPKGDGVTLIFVDAPQREDKDRGCVPITVKVKKVVFPP